MATATKRNKSYFISVSCGLNMNGKQIRKTTTFTPTPGLTPKQEKKALDEFMFDFERKIREGRILDGGIKFADFAQKWFEDYGDIHLAAKTNLRYKSLILRINSAIGHIKLDKFQPHHLTAFYKNLKEDCLNKRTGGKLSDKTIHHHHQLINTILNTAVQWQVIFDNPAKRVKPPRVTKKEINYLDDKQAQEFVCALNNVPIKYKTAFTLAIYSGLRRGELCGLKWQDIDFENNLLDVKRSLQFISSKGLIEKAPKTNSSIRTIKLPNDAICLLREYKKYQIEERLRLGSAWIDNNFVFVQWNGEPMHPDTLTDYFGKLRKKLDLPQGITLHSLRHTNATLLIAAGTNVSTVSKRLGHAQTSTTVNIYSHAIRTADEKASEVLQDMLHPVIIRKI